MGTEGLDHVRHGLEPIDLFDAELSNVGEDGGPCGDGGGDGEDGNFVERRNLAGMHLRGGQGAGERADGRHARVTGDDGDIRPHPLKDRDVAEPGRSAVDAGNVDGALRHDTPRHGEERGGGGVAGHGPIYWSERRCTDPHNAPFAPGFDRQVGPGFNQHLLGVRTGRHRLAHDGRAVG